MAFNSIPYILLFSFSLFFSLFYKTFELVTEERVKYKCDKTYLQFFYLSILCVFLGCRGLIGTDWQNYYAAFKDAPTLLVNSEALQKYFSKVHFEKGYAFYNIICKSLCNNYFAFQFITSAIDIFLLHRIFNLYCKKDYYLAWTFFLCFNGFLLDIIILRNTKAILLFILSIQYINRRKPLKYFLLNFVGFLFHSSALLYFPLYILAFIKRNKKIEILTYFISLIIYIFQIPWISNILLNLLPSKLYTLYAWYLVSDKYSASTGITIGFLERFFTFVIFFVNIDKLLEEDRRLLPFWYCMLIYLFVYNFFSEAYILIERIPNLFICSYWILYTRLYRLLRREKKVCFLIILFCYGALKLFLYFNVFWGYYENFLFKDLNMTNRAEIYLKH